MSIYLKPVRGLIFLAAACWAAPALAQSVESVTVTEDVVRLLRTDASDTAFGLGKPLLETPRAVTLISDTTIARYGIEGVDDLTAITPSAYTASYYGVEGTVSLRGTLAENYFRGFKRAENRGTYATPLANAAGIEILRGPPSPAAWSTSSPRRRAPAMRSAAKSASPMAATANATSPARSARR
jgi:outer membrane receptor for monomeric catechols